MPELLLGVETEYAVSGFGPSGRRLESETVAEGLLTVARQEHRCLPDGTGSGLFLANGSRLYVDCGYHPELATPECSDPWEAVRYIKAGERLLSGLAARALAEDADLADVNIFRCNVDYSGAGATWGCHESYLHRADPSILPAQLIPHLVSRVIYAGAGGFNPVSPGLEFTLSPRARLFSNVSSTHSTHARGIYHTKNESLSGEGYHRLHVICGESLCSERATLLKLGTTALIVAAIDAGLRSGDAVQLRAPLDASRAFAADPECRARVRLVSGRRVSALDIQRHYLEHVEERLAARKLPWWARELCELWRGTLDDLERDAASSTRTLDWAIKRALYDHWLEARLDPAQLAHWNHIIGKLHEALSLTEYADHAVTVDFVLSKGSPVRKQVLGLSRYLSERGLEWSGLSPFLQLRQEMLEADVRFGQLGDHGIFERLDAEGRIDHRVVDAEEVARAEETAPNASRARLRGEWVRRLGSTDAWKRYRCDWTGVWDARCGRYLDLSDPWAREARWRERGEENRGDEARSSMRSALAALALTEE